MSAPVNCPHWRVCGVRGGGCCAVNKYPRPSYGVCNIVCLGNKDWKPGPVPAPVPRDKWPWRIKLLAALKSEKDTGIGDTASRLLGGERTKKLYSRLLGRDCGCSSAQARLNATYRY